MGSQPRGISASRGVSVLGLNDWQSQWEIWVILMEERYPGFCAEKGIALPVFEGNASTRWGTAFEDSIVELAEQATGQKISSREDFFIFDLESDDPNRSHPTVKLDNATITCHIDGLYVGHGKQPLHEGKTAQSWVFREKWGTPGTDQIPKNYQIQCQHQMLCTDAEKDIVSVLVFPDSPDNWEKMGLTVKVENWLDKDEWCISGPNENWINRCQIWAESLSEMGFFHQFPVTANRDLQKLIVDGYSDFWHRNILEKQEPKIDRYEDILRAFPSPSGVLVVDPLMESWLLELSETKEEISKTGRLGKRVEELKTIILDTARKTVTVPDEGSETKLIFKNAQGKKLGQYNGKTFLT